MKSAIVRVGVWAVCLLVSATAAAQTAPGFSLQRFRPAVDSQGLVTVNASQTLGHLDFSLGLVGNYAYDTLAMSRLGTQYAVNHYVTMQLQGAIGLFGGSRWRDRLHDVSFELGVSLPVNIMEGARSPSFVAPDGNANDNRKLTFSGQSIGDFGLNLKMRFLNPTRHKVGLALLLAVDFPSGNAKQLLGEGQTTFRPTLILDREFGKERRFRLSLNFGALVRPHQHSFTDMGTEVSFTGGMACAPLQASGACGTGLTRAVGSELTYSVGASYAVVPHRFDLIAEVFGSHDLTTATGGNPVEVLAAAKVYMAQNSFFEVGASAGALPRRIVDGQSNMTGLPLVRGFVGFVFEPTIHDRDHDGIKDDIDRCPDDPETYNGFEDEDGCPDELPKPPPPPPPAPEPEAQPEVEEPLPPELQDKPLRVERHGGVLKTFEKVYFKTASAEILPRSFPLLNDVVELLKSSSDIHVLEIAGHADERGNDDYNLKLTEARAQSVRAYLIEHGIAEERLVARGYGETTPATDPRTLKPCTAHGEHCWDMNRRVEFVIVR